MFHVYVFFLIVSGAALLVMAGVKNGLAPARKVWYFVLGAAFALYGLYLLLFFHGGHYILFYYVFILPVLLTVRFFRDRSANQARQQAPVPDFQGATGYGQTDFAQQPGFEQPHGHSYGQPPADGSHHH